MTSLRSQVADLPRVLRYGLVAAVAAFLLGGLVGLVLGLLTYPPTSWFAVIEVAIPATVLGAVVGVVVATVTSGVASAIRH